MPGTAHSQQPALVKCLVWDLDNTLWDGILLEGDNTVPRDGTRELITELDSRGILQSVASKNDHEQAWMRLVELGLAEFFVLPKIGFGGKAESVRQIADQLNFDLGTIAFMDDQPAERAEVAFHLPQVRCYTAEQMSSLANLPEFSPATVTVDARRRRLMYQASFQREAEQADFQGSDEEFLRSLNMVLTVERATDGYLARIEELTLRTSQMNATGVHYSDSALRGLLADPDHEILVVSLTDRFGPHGAVGVLLTARRRGVWHIKLLATSCRVLSYGVGAVILRWLTDQAAQTGVHLVADFRATERNRIAELAYRFADFSESSCTCQAAVEAAADQAIQRFHLEPKRQPTPITMRLLAPELTAGAPDAQPCGG